MNIKDIIYDKTIGKEVRALLSHLCTDDLDANSRTFDQLQTLIFKNLSLDAWEIFVNFLYKNVPDIFTCFSKLNDYAFTGLTTIKNICIPENIECIKSYCFDKNIQLEYVTVESGSKLDYLAESTFSRCNMISTLDLANSKITQFFCQYFFSYQPTLLLPNTVKLIHDYSLSPFQSVLFPYANSIQDLDLAISNLALTHWSNADYYGREIEIATRTNSDIITKDARNSKIALGPELSKNTNIKII